MRPELNNHYVAMVAERMSPNNADILAQFIICGKKERNISYNTIMSYIDGVVYLENYHEHKDFEKIDKNDIISFLDSYRKSEALIQPTNFPIVVVIPDSIWTSESASGNLLRPSISKVTGA